MIDLLRLAGSKQLWRFGLPVLLSVNSTKMKLFIIGVGSWTGLMTLVASIFSISCQKVCLRWIGMGLQGVCLGVMDGFIWMWYGSPGNQPMPSKGSWHCSWICSFDFMIHIFFSVSSWGILDLEVGRMDAEFGCVGDIDCACISLLG